VVLALRLFASGASAEVSEPSVNLAVQGVLAATLVTAALRAALLGRARLPAPRVAVPLAIVVATAWLSLLRAEDASQGLRRAISWTGDAGALLLFTGLAGHGKALRAGLLAAALAGGAVLLGLVAKERLVDVDAARAAYLADPSVAEVPAEMQADFRARLFTEQVSGPFVIPNGLGACLAVLALAAAGAAAGLAREGWGAARGAGGAGAGAGLGAGAGAGADARAGAGAGGGKGWARGGAVLAGALALGFVLAIPLAGQKGAWLGLGAGGAAALGLALGRGRPGLRRGLAAAALLAAVGVVTVVAIVPSARWEALPGGLSVAVRREYAETALALVREAPLAGVGAGNFGVHAARVKPERAEETRYAHMDLLEVAAEQGVVAAAALAALWAALLWGGGRRRAEGVVGARVAQRAQSSQRTGVGESAALGVGFALGLAMLTVLGVRYREPRELLLAAAVFGGAYAAIAGPLERALAGGAARRAIAAGGVGAGAAFAAQSGVDFLHVESGLLAVALACVAVARGPLLTRERALGPAGRALLPLGAVACFLALALSVLPAAITADAERGRADDLLREGKPAEALAHADAALDASPRDPALLARVADILADLARRAPTVAARAELTAAAVERYRAVVRDRSGLSDVKARLAALLHLEAQPDAYDAAVAAYPSHPRRRLEAGLACTRAAEAAPPLAKPALAARARAHLEAALRLSPLVRHERLRLSPSEAKAARAALDSLVAPPYHAPRE